MFRLRQGGPGSMSMAKPVPSPLLLAGQGPPGNVATVLWEVLLEVKVDQAPASGI